MKVQTSYNYLLNIKGAVKDAFLITAYFLRQDLLCGFDMYIDLYFQLIKEGFFVLTI